LEILEFQEWGKGKACKLSDSEHRAISRFSGALHVKVLGGGRYRITPTGGFVGSVALSQKLQVVVRPKVPLSAFFSLCALAFGTSTLPAIRGWAGYELGSPSEWLSLIFLAAVTRLCRGGLRRGYVEIEERTPAIRGRLVFNDHRLATLPLCKYSDFSLDTAENRVVRAGLELVIRNVTRPELRAQALASIDNFQETLSLNLHHLNLASITLTALTAQYEVVMQLAAMLRAGSGFSPEPGEKPGPGLFFPMHEIFEKAVYNCLRACAASGYVLYQPNLTSIVNYVTGTPNIPVSMIPDVAISAKPTAYYKSQSHTSLVLDAKYKTPMIKTQFRTSFRNQDIYQIMSYGQALSCPGLLVYPAHGEEIDVQYRVGGQSFRIITVDLNDPTLSAFKKTLSDILV